MRGGGHHFGQQDHPRRHRRLLSDEKVSLGVFIFLRSRFHRQTAGLSKELQKSILWGKCFARDRSIRKVADLGVLTGSVDNSGLSLPTDLAPWLSPVTKCTPHEPSAITTLHSQSRSKGCIPGSQNCFYNTLSGGTNLLPLSCFGFDLVSVRRLAPPSAARYIEKADDATSTRFWRIHIGFPILWRCLILWKWSMGRGFTLLLILRNWRAWSWTCACTVFESINTVLIHQMQTQAYTS